MGTMKPEAEAGQIALKEERHQYILELLGSEGRVLAADLSSRYRVSEDTIRRDLRELASSGKIQRVHGGALPRRAEAVPFVSRQQIDMESKIGIARAAADMIRDGQVVLIDGGTTNLRIASYLSRERSATIVTNSPPLALALADHPKLSVLMLGGTFLKEARVTTGIETIRLVESIRADLCFLGMCSLHPEVGITVGDREEAYVKQAMIGASTEVVGLISLGKMGTSLPYLVGPASRLIAKCLLLELMVAVSVEAQQSVPPAPAWTGVVRTAAGEPVAGAKVTVFTSGAKKNPTAVTGTDGRFAIADIRLGPHNVSVQLPGRRPTAPAAVDILGLTVVLTV